MINTIYRTLETLINKEQSGYLSPEEFNHVANLVQLEIFRNYFEDINRDQVKENRGLSSTGYGDLSHNERQRVQQFSEYAQIMVDSGEGEPFATANIPEDVYFLDRQGLLTGDGKVIEEVAKQSFGYVSRSISTFSKLYPVYSQFGDQLRIYPADVTGPLSATYIRKPKAPRWTYRVVNGTPMFDPTSSSFQDFELHTSEFSNIILRMLTHFGLNLRENEVMQIAEQLKQNLTVKDNS